MNKVSKKRKKIASQITRIVDYHPVCDKDVSDSLDYLLSSLKKHRNYKIKISVYREK